MEIQENNESHLEAFIRLNEEWISKYFELEEVDHELAANPEQIIEKGGYVFSCLSGKSVIGVCALFNQGNGVYELARMAVSPKYQGRGIGNQLMLHSLKKLLEINAEKVFLVSNTLLTTGIALYKKHSFQIVSEGQHPMYSRANIVMERQIRSLDEDN